MANSVLRIYASGAAGEQEIKGFEVTANDVSGTGPCGVLYAASYNLTPEGGANVHLTATVPQGVELLGGFKTEELRQRVMAFYLSADQLAGRAFKELLLPGVGRAKLRLEFTAGS